jgi:chromosome segregation ATPase
LAQVEPLVKGLATLAGQENGLRASVASLEEQAKTLKAQNAKLAAEAATLKQDALDEVRQREAAHQFNCQNMTLKAQREVELIEQHKQAVMEDHKKIVAGHNDAVYELTAQQADLLQDIKELQDQLAEMKSKLGPLVN